MIWQKQLVDEPKLETGYGSKYAEVICLSMKKVAFSL
jgi:hypothetical protein